MIEFAVPLLTGALVLVVLFDIRRRAADKHHTQMQHIRSCQDLFDSHCASLTEFLDARDAPEPLKRLLMAFSDIISDREAMMGVADFLRSQRKLSLSDEDEETAAQIDRLKNVSPHLTLAFASAVVTGILAGLLRWPETSSQFEILSARLFSDPRRDVAMAVTVSRYRKIDLDFTKGLRQIGVVA